MEASTPPSGNKACGSGYGLRIRLDLSNYTRFDSLKRVLMDETLRIMIFVCLKGARVFVCIR
jgi:hypothetical protein